VSVLQLDDLRDVSAFRNWLRTAGRLGASLSSGGDAMGLADDRSPRQFRIRLDRTEVLRAAVTAIEEKRARVWADDASDLALALADRLGDDVETFTLISCMTTAIAILEPGLGQKPRPTALGPRAAATARDALRISTGHPPALRRVALASVAQDALWRPVQQRGLLLGMAVLKTKTEEALAEQEASRVKCNTDLTRDDDATYAWIARRGIQILDKNGAPSLSRDDFAHATIPDAAQEAWRTFRAARSLKSTLGKLVEFSRYQVDGRIYPTIVARSGTKTGRAKTLRPGYHNLNRNLRGLILARPGYSLVSLDIDRAEPSIAAALSGDRQLAAALLAADPYEELAIAQYGEAARGDDVLRGRFKKCLLAAFYQQGPSSLAADLAVTVEDAKAIQADLRRAWPVLFAWIDGILQSARSGIRLTTLSGRYLPIPDRGDEYKTVNWTLQATASDLFCDSVDRVAGELGASSLYLGIHDEIVLEVADRDVEWAMGVLASKVPTTINGVRIGGTPQFLGGRWGK
jgi:hypothetical protein